MDWLYYILLLLFVFTGVVLNVLTLPGNWLMLLVGIIYALVTKGRYIGVWWLVAVLVTATLGEIIEFASAGKASAKAGGSRWGGVGGLVGGVLGGLFLSGAMAVVLPPSIIFMPIAAIAGILIGTFFGAAGGELIAGKPISASLLIGAGATQGRLVGTLMKVAVGGLIALVILVAALPVWG